MTKHKGTQLIRIQQDKAQGIGTQRVGAQQVGLQVVRGTQKMGATGKDMVVRNPSDRNAAHLANIQEQEKICNKHKG